MGSHRIISEPLSLITIDFWGTLVDPRIGGEARHKVRHQALCELAWNHQEDLSEHNIEAAAERASENFNRIWLNDHRTPITKELVKTILKQIGIPASENEVKELVRQFEESLWEGPPALAEGSADIIKALAEQRSLAIISDTKYSPGRVIRTYLDNHSLLHYFDAFVFSDEVGYSKPSPRAFEQVLEDTGAEAHISCHIGDRMDTDVAGAKGVGMKAILFTGIFDRRGNDKSGISPDYTCNHWKEIGGLLV